MTSARTSTPNGHESTALCADPHCRLLSVKSVARMLGKSERFVWGLHARGVIPAPVRLGRSVNWRREDIDLWIQLGCPSREEFERVRKAGEA